MVEVTGVEKKSPAAHAGVREGDILLSVNGHEINDVLDYRFYLADERLELLLLRGGKEKRVRLKKREEADIGLLFESPLMDNERSCRNGCIFCFIDQNPKGMRETCYFKDDDSRLSFLHGNYITMTNMLDRDVERIIEMHISPINISVHTTNPELRCKMMNNRFAGEKLEYIRRFADAGLRICAQIVLCRGINDGDELSRTMHDLVGYLPALDSVSIVPAGLTAHREGLYPLELFTPEECREVISEVDAMAAWCKREHGRRVFWCSDEFYIRGELPLPSEDFYEDFSQIENGVGLLPSFIADAERELMNIEKSNTPRHISVATGYAAYDEISKLARKAEEAHGSLKVEVYRIRNDFFGETVTVAGLLTGRDIADQLRGRELGELLLFPPNALRAERDLFLCGMSPEELSAELGVPVKTQPYADGGLFIEALCGGNDIDE